MQDLPSPPVVTAITNDTWKSVPRYLWIFLWTRLLFGVRMQPWLIQVLCAVSSTAVWQMMTDTLLQLHINLEQTHHTSTYCCGDQPTTSMTAAILVSLLLFSRLWPLPWTSHSICAAIMLRRHFPHPRHLGPPSDCSDFHHSYNRIDLIPFSLFTHNRTHRFPFYTCLTLHSKYDHTF